MRRFHGLLIAALPAPLGRVLLLHALHEVVELDGGPAQSLQPGRDGDPPAGAAASTSACRPGCRSGRSRWPTASASSGR